MIDMEDNSAQTVTVPRATWDRMRALAELGEKVEAGEYVARSALDGALSQVHELTARMQAMLKDPVQVLAATSMPASARMLPKALAQQQQYAAALRANGGHELP